MTGNRERTVLIIGAGAAGLAAASAIAEAGDAVTVLEARERPGGRIHTLDHAGAGGPVELGAEFVHGRHPDLWRMAQSAGMLVYETGGEHLYASGSRLARDDSIWERVGHVFERMMSSGRAEQSFAEFIRDEFRGRESVDMVRWSIAFVEGFNAADHRRVSLKWLIEEERASAAIEGERQFRSAAGYSRLIGWLEKECLRHGATIRRSTVVRSVRWRPAHVLVDTASGETLEADAAVIAVPLAVLQAGAIRFEPAIAANLAAAERLMTGQVVRITLLCKSAFWEHPLPAAGSEPFPRLGFLHAPDEPFPTWWTQYPLQSRLITGWAGGPKADALVRSSRDQRIEAALDSLAHATGWNRKEIDGMVEEACHHPWDADPFSRGAYSYVPSGALDAVEQLARPCERTLYFAGEATDTTGHLGTVHGAIASGLRAARELMGGH